ILTTGRASWYAHKGGNFAASPDFPAGSVLRVYNQANGKYVDVTVNDWGPERDKHPDRVVDLDKVAFSKIASTGAGVIDVYVEPLVIVPDADGKELGFDKDGLTGIFNIKAKSAIAINEDTGKIIWEKNATSTLPLASLSKLIAAKVFLDTNPVLSEKIAYSKKDEEYNYAYCKPWESAKIKLAEGDELTFENLIYGSLVGSANNTIETMVRASGLARDEFIKKMNESVIEWGASTTHFVEPTGLSPENVSSASDYAIILKEVLTNPIIQKASVMSRYVFSTLNTDEEHRITNTNKIIQTRDFNFTGSKTGYLDEAGYCLATRVLHGVNNLIVVTFGAATRDQSFSETVDLIKYAILNI
ncbi:MAG: RlpA-like double-psi beta-barrel domain-containing protein, partial [Candidatus Magasanikbacteria bacterium]|nr:RlpA-like double-psi beta-barrel domain-containing protein [Candidatus Magasanikbacteria bacterium]